jgi:hypothetical protein
MNLVIVTFTCERDAEFMAPWRSMIERCYPGAKIVVAGVDTVNLWATHGAPAAVRQTLAEVAHNNRDADWIIKTDVDVAHLKPNWLTDHLDKGRVIGCQQHRKFPWGFQGLAYAIQTPFVHRMMRAFDCPTCPCKSQKDEDCAMSLAAYIADPNAIHLHRFDPLGKGIFAHWNPSGCRSVSLYRDRFDLVHCGTEDTREKSVGIFRQFDGSLDP